MSPSPIYHQDTILPPRTLSQFILSHPTTIQTQSQSPTPTLSESEVTSSSTTLATSITSTTYPNTTPEQTIEMHTRRNNLVETRTTKPTLMTRLRGRHANTRTVKTTTKIEPATTATGHHTHTTHHARTTRRSGWGRNRRTAQPVVHHRRHASIGDKISGAMMKLRGSLTRRPGLKAAGTRRMHGTDGRGSHRVY